MAPTSIWCWWTCGNTALDGKAAEDRLHTIGITVNRTVVPFYLRGLEQHQLNQ